MQNYASLLQIQLNEKNSSDWEVSTCLRPFEASFDYHCNDYLTKIDGPSWAEGNAQ